jgi:hypothetical protein
MYENKYIKEYWSSSANLRRRGQHHQNAEYKQKHLGAEQK